MNRYGMRRSLAASLLLLVGCNAAIAAPDEEAARVQLKSNDCLKCHALERTKTGPALTKIAAKYKGNPEAEDKIMAHITTGPTITMPDGTEAQHKIIETRDPHILKNLVEWILSL